MEIKRLETTKRGSGEDGACDGKAIITFNCVGANKWHRGGSNADWAGAARCSCAAQTHRRTGARESRAARRGRAPRRRRWQRWAGRAAAAEGHSTSTWLVLQMLYNNLCMSNLFLTPENHWLDSVYWTCQERKANFVVVPATPFLILLRHSIHQNIHNNLKWFKPRQYYNLWSFNITINVQCPLDSMTIPHSNLVLYILWP